MEYKIIKCENFVNEIVQTYKIHNVLCDVTSKEISSEIKDSNNGMIYKAFIMILALFVSIPHAKATNTLNETAKNKKAARNLFNKNYKHETSTTETPDVQNQNHELIKTTDPHVRHSPKAVKCQRSLNFFKKLSPIFQTQKRRKSTIQEMTLPNLQDA